MEMILYFGFIFGIFYVLTLTVFAVGFLKTKTYKPETQTIDSELFISVIIPFKNAVKHIEATVKSLLSQNLDSSKFELIFVNDFSEDSSSEILEKLNDNTLNFNVLFNKYSTGKKFALRTGIELAKGSVIVTTDADCVSLPNRLSLIYNCFAQLKPKLLILPVHFSADTIFEKMQALDFLSLTASGYGAAGAGCPILCNGANLAYEKAVFWEFQDEFRYDIPSGDDMFLLHAVKKKYPTEIKFLKSREAAVITPAEQTFAKLVRQRTRWAGKSKHFRDADTLVVAFIVLIFNIYIPFGIYFSISEQSVFFLFPIVAKFLPDLYFLSINAFYFKQLRLLWYFPITWVFGFLFTSFIAVWSFALESKISHK